MEMMKCGTAIAVMFLVGVAALQAAGDEAAAKQNVRPTGIAFLSETMRRIGGSGDNWCITWAADDSQIVSMDDGNWLKGPKSFSNHLYRLVGPHTEFERQDVPNYPEFIFGARGWFGYGIVSVDGVLYSFVSKCPKNGWSGLFRGVKLLRSPDNGATWYRVNGEGKERRLAPQDEVRYTADREEMFFFEESPAYDHGGEAYPFSFCAFAQHGRDNSAAKDDFVYVYAPEGARAHELLLARVPKKSLGNRKTWEFFVGMKKGEPRWRSTFSEREPIHFFPANNSKGDVFGWYSWLPSVVWNEGLGLYIMVNGGTYAGKGLTGRAQDYYSSWMHTKSGSLGFWYSEKPWGPWIRFFYTEEWVLDDAGNRTYQPKLSPKWISEDGSRMVLIWSDAMKNERGQSHTVNYKWNQMEIAIETGPAE
jgi:hypothetical protein